MERDRIQKVYGGPMSPRRAQAHKSRDLAAIVTRLATAGPARQINLDRVIADNARVQRLWRSGTAEARALSTLMTTEQRDVLDPFDCVQLARVRETCCASRSLSNARQTLFTALSRQRTSTNDADRLR